MADAPPCVRWLFAAAHHDGVLRLGEVLELVEAGHAGLDLRLRQGHRAGVASGRKGSDGGEHLCCEDRVGDEDVWVPRCRRRHRQKLKDTAGGANKFSETAFRTRAIHAQPGDGGAWRGRGRQASFPRIAEPTRPRRGKPARPGPRWITGLDRREAVSRPKGRHSGSKRPLGRKQRKRKVVISLRDEIGHRGHRLSVPLAAPRQPPETHARKPR